MNNNGRITVFLCLVISSILLLGITAINVINIFMAKEKAAVAVRSSVSGVKAGYNSYIFEHYHILLFDKSCGGQGEAALEEKLISGLEENLGSNFTVNEAAVTDFKYIYDDGCMKLKEQIREYMSYAAVEYGAEQILESTGGQDGTLAQEIIRDMEAAENNQASGEAVVEAPAESKADAAGAVGIDDPRDFTANMSDIGVLSIVIPDDMDINSEKIDLSEVPSIKKLGLVSDFFRINDDFDNYTTLKADLKARGTWKDALIDYGLGTAYARNVFNCAVNTEVNEDTAFDCELEYLICGKESDYANLNSVVKKLLALRFPVNYTYLISDAAKMAQISAISGPLSVMVFIPEPILKYLIAGCWSYVEAMADVRCLLEGRRIAFAKNDGNWITDLNDLEESVLDEGSSDDKGMCYEDYLMILMALDMDKVYYRMLDIMELNVRRTNEQFQIENGAVELSVDFDISFGEWNFYINQTGKY